MPNKAEVLGDVWKRGVLCAVMPDRMPNGGIVRAVNVDFAGGGLRFRASGFPPGTTGNADTTDMGTGSAIVGLFDDVTPVLAPYSNLSDQEARRWHIAAVADGLYANQYDATLDRDKFKLLTNGTLTDPGDSRYPFNGERAAFWAQFSYGSPTKHVVIYSDGINPIKEIDLSAKSVSDLGGTPPTAFCMIKFMSHLLLGYTDPVKTTASPFRVQWSDTGNPANWSSGNAGFVDLEPKWGAVQHMETMGDRLYIYTEHAVWECTYVGPPKMFDFHRVAEGLGAKRMRVVHTGTSHIVYASDGRAYEFDGRTFTPIDEPVSREASELAGYPVTTEDLPLNKEPLYVWFCPYARTAWFVRSGGTYVSVYDQETSSWWMYTYGSDGHQYQAISRHGWMFGWLPDAASKPQINVYKAVGGTPVKYPNTSHGSGTYTQVDMIFPKLPSASRILGVWVDYHSADFVSSSDQPLMVQVSDDPSGLGGVYAEFTPYHDVLWSRSAGVWRHSGNVTVADTVYITLKYASGKGPGSVRRVIVLYEPVKRARSEELGGG